jgi:hypothetical protein
LAIRSALLSLTPQSPLSDAERSRMIVAGSPRLRLTPAR